MSKVRVKIKRTVAAFLAFCMLLSSFNGVAWADTGAPDDDYYPESRDVVFKLDANQMRSEAALAVQNGLMGQEAVTLESLGLSAQNKSNVKNAYANLFADENSQIYEMVVPYAFDENNDENNNWMYEIPDGASMRMFVRVPNQVASSSNAEEDEEYSLSGEENFLFLFINNSEYDLTFSVEVNNKRTKPVEVPYKESIAVKRATDSNPAFPGGALTPGTAVTEPTTSVAESSAVNPSETSAADSTDVTASSTEESATAAADASTEESTTESDISSTEAETATTEEGTETETTAAVDNTEKTTEAAAKETTEAAIENSTEASTEAAAEDKTEAATEAVAEKETEESPEAATEAAEKEPEAAKEPEEEPAEATEENKEPVTVSKSKHETVLVASAMEDDWEPQSPDEDPELMDDEEEEEYPGYLDEEEENEERDTTKNDTVEIVTGTVLKAVLLGSEGSNGLFAAFIGNSGSEEGSARLTEVKGSELLAVKETESPFKVTLYDYSGTGGDWSQNKINNYIGGGNKKLGTGLVFGGGNGPQNAFKVSNSNVNIVQGITEPELSSNGTLINRYTKANLFPSSQPSGVSTDILKVYENVNADQLFVKNSNGYYVFDSSAVGGKYDGSQNALVPLSNSEKNGNNYKNAGGIQDGANKLGFWPFKKTNWYFGMKVAFDFSVLEDGMYNGEPMIFEFRGDDDVWVYLTDKKDGSQKGKIVLDVGGNHNAMGGTINFATGEIAYKKVHPDVGNGQVVSYRYDGNNPNTGENKMTKYPSTINPKAYLYTLEDAMATTGYSESKVMSMYPLGFMGLKRQELAEYTLNFYYLERGGKGSNCYLRFNMPVIEKDEITLNKRVYSENADDKTNTYKFDLYYRTKGSGEFEAYEKNPIVLNGDTNATKIIDQKFLEGTEYYFVERTNSASATKWTNAPGNGLKSPSYFVGKTNSVVCSNYFEVNPTVEKKADLIGVGDNYDITLGVNGNTLTADEGDEEAYLTNIVATDPLSEYVDFADYEEAKGPSLRLVADAAEQQLTSQNIGNGLYRYTLAGTNTTVADVDVYNKVIKWFVTKENDTADTLKKGESKYLIYTVKTTEKAVYYGNGAYPHKGAAATGTYAGKSGYYSNGNAELKAAVLDSETTIGVKNDQLIFPQPVVRPTEKGILTVSKELAEGAEKPEDGTEFNFQVEVSNVTTAHVVREYRGEFKEIAVVNGKLNDKIALTANESCTYTGLNEAAEYRIEEEAYTSEIYSSEVEKVVVTKDGVEEIKTPANAVKGTISKEETVTFYNTFTTMTKPVLKLTKTVSGADAPTYATAERYEYVIKDGNGVVFTDYTWDGNKPVELTKGQFGFVITDAYRDSDNTVQIVFNKALERGNFQIVEQNSGTATDIVWSMDSKVESTTDTLNFELTDTSVETGISMTCENIYDKSELSIVKRMVGDNAVPDAWYKFDVQFFNRAGMPGLEAGQTVTATLVSDAGKAKLYTGDAEEMGKDNAEALKVGSDGTLTIYMTADAEVRLNGILRGTGCEVSEDLAALDGLYYKTRLDSVDKTVTAADGISKTDKEALSGVSHKFDAANKETVQFTFRNAVEAVRMNLHITKQLVDEAGAPKKDIEDVSFVFKITDNDSSSPNYNNVFYKRISISADEDQPENTITIYNLPYSQDYQVEEMGQMRYQVVGSSIQSAVPVKNGSGEFEAAVVFQNRKMEESLFSNTSVTTNKFVLNKDGSYVFERNNDMPNDRLPQPEALVAYDLPRKPKTGNYGSDGFDDGDTQLV